MIEFRQKIYSDDKEPRDGLIRRARKGIAKKMDRKLGKLNGERYHWDDWNDPNKVPKYKKGTADKVVKELAPHLSIQTGLDSKKIGCTGNNDLYEPITKEENEQLLKDLERWRSGDHSKKPQSLAFKEPGHYNIRMATNPLEPFVLAHEVGHNQNMLDNNMYIRMRKKLNGGNISERLNSIEKDKKGNLVLEEIDDDDNKFFKHLAGSTATYLEEQKANRRFMREDRRSLKAAGISDSDIEKAYKFMSRGQRKNYRNRIKADQLRILRDKIQVPELRGKYDKEAFEEGYNSVKKKEGK